MTTPCPKCGAPVPIPLRSTGARSQNHSVHGFASQIARWLDDGSTTKTDVIQEAATRAGLPSFENRFGRFVFKHESSWTKEEASRVIDKLKEIAQDMDIRLVEINEND